MTLTHRRRRGEGEVMVEEEEDGENGMLVAMEMRWW